jgi:hypothetical protein
MTVTRRVAAILAADCDEISETGLLVIPKPPSTPRCELAPVYEVAA